MRVRFKEKILSASAYFFGIPSLYIVLTCNKKNGYVGVHGAHAFTLWISFIAIFFLMRFFINLTWRAGYLPQLEMLEIISLTAMGCCLSYFGFQSLFGGRI